jgi:2'-5' RNA ligase
VRLFTSIDISDGLRNKITRVQDRLKKNNWDVKWVEKGNLHITLCFIGDVKGTNVEVLKRDLVHAGEFVPPFTLKVDALDVIKSCVIALSVAGDLADFARLQRFVASVSGRGVRCYPPHITLGRFRGCYSEGGYQDGWLTRDFPSIVVNDFTLYSSKLTPKGPSYNRLGDFSLGS